MTTPLRELPGLRPCRLRRSKAEARLGFIWHPDGAITTDVEKLRVKVPICELAAFENDLVNTGHVYAVEWDDGSLHHLPLLYFMKPEGNS